SGRTYIQAVLPTVGLQLQSFENAQSVPSSGAYSVGDIVWKSNSSIGFTGWINTVAGSPGTFVQFGTIASGTATMTTAAIASQACGATVTVAASGVLTTDAIASNDSAQPAAATNGVLTLKKWPTAN